MKKHPNIIIALMFSLVLSILVYLNAYIKKDNNIKAEPEYVAMGDVSIIDSTIAENTGNNIIESKEKEEVSNQTNIVEKTVTESVEKTVEEPKQIQPTNNAQSYSTVNPVVLEEDVNIPVTEYAIDIDKVEEVTNSDLAEFSAPPVKNTTQVNTRQEQAYNNILGVNPSIQVTEQFNGFSLSNILYKYVPIGNTYYVAENGSAPGNAILQLTEGQPVTIEGVNYTVSKVISNIYYPDAHSVIFSNLSGRAYLQTCERPGEYTYLRLVILS